MPSLSEKLKSLGVTLGSSALPATGTKPDKPSQVASNLEELLSGRWITTTHGDAYLIETDFPADYPYGASRLSLPGSLDNLAIWAGEPGLISTSPQSIAFVDTETTGLSGGTGTMAFLIGIGKYEADHFHLAQFFLPDPANEPAELIAVEELLAATSAVVTFNGKSFDLPLLRTRYLLHGWQPPFNDYAHVDLLHLARRLWRDRLPSRTLGNLEVQILGASRSEQDIPGWIIPQMYLDYLHTGDPAPLKRVIYHNAMDILSLAALFNHLSSLMSAPLDADLPHGVDIFALARLFEDMGLIETATRLFIRGLEHPDIISEYVPRSVYLDAIQRLAGIHKKQEQLNEAIRLWELAAHHEHLDAYVELAKYYEHQKKDYIPALEWTQAAIDLLNSPGFPAYERRAHLPELEHRYQRLKRKQTDTSQLDDETRNPS